jgi:hypothetical protein
MSPRNAGRVSFAGLVLALAVSAVSAQAADAPAFKSVRIAAPFSAGTVERALVGARRRLAQPSCQRIFSEFADKNGRPLVEALEEKGTSGPEHLGTLFFYDGSEEPQCQSEATLAFTSVGSAVVFVCPTQFTRAARRNPFLAEAAIIHEGLHTLGLGENPPTSTAITSRVMFRCGG